MSSSVGSLVLASFCDDKNIGPCFWVASSKALIERCRPTKSGTTICGKTTISLSGSKGTRTGPPTCSLSSFLSLRNNIDSPLSALCGLGVYDNRSFVPVDHVVGNNDLLDVRLGRHVVHNI